MKSVLVVDDSATMRMFVGEALKSEGYEVVVVEGGDRALEVLGTRTFDILMTDQTMPGMDGLSLLDEVRKEPRHAATKLVLMTGKSDETGVASQGIHFLEKPFPLAKLFALLDTF